MLVEPAPAVASSPFALNAPPTGTSGSLTNVSAVATVLSTRSYPVTVYVGGVPAPAVQVMALEVYGLAPVTVSLPVWPQPAVANAGNTACFGPRPPSVIAELNVSEP